MKKIIYILIFLIPVWPFYGQCEEGFKDAFNHYIDRLENFEYGHDIFHMKMMQKTYFDLDGKIQSKEVLSELISNGILKHLEVGNATVYTNSSTQVLIDRDKQTIVISPILSPDVEKIGFSGFEQMNNFVSNVRCKALKSNGEEQLTQYFFENDSIISPRRNKATLVVNDHHEFKSYEIRYTEDVPGGVDRIEILFELIDFNYKSNTLSENILSHIFDKKGKLRDHFANYKLVDLRQNN